MSSLRDHRFLARTLKPHRTLSSRFRPWGTASHVTVGVDHPDLAYTASTIPPFWISTPHRRDRSKRPICRGDPANSLTTRRDGLYSVNSPAEISLSRSTAPRGPIALRSCHRDFIFVIVTTCRRHSGEYWQFTGGHWHGPSLNLTAVQTRQCRSLAQADRLPQLSATPVHRARSLLAQRRRRRRLYHWRSRDSDH